MAKNSGLNKVGDAATAVAAIGAALAVLKPLVEPIADKIVEAAKDRKQYVEIPYLYSKEISLTLERAKALLEDSGLRVEPIQIREADAKYKDCFDMQVVGSNPGHKRRVKPGTLVYLKYVTGEIAEKSKLIFEESEKQKLEIKEDRERKRLEQKDKKRQARNDAAIATKHQMTRMLPGRGSNKNDSPDT